MAYGVQQEDVFGAADALLRDGVRPTIEKVRQRLGRGSPNTVSPMLDAWFSTLGERLHPSGAGGASGVGSLPSVLVQGLQALWSAAQQEAHAQLVAEKALVQQSHQELEAQQATLARERAAMAQVLPTLQGELAGLRDQLAAEQRQAAQRQQQLAQALHQQQALQDTLVGQEALIAREREAAAQALEATRNAHVQEERRLTLSVDRLRQDVKAGQSALEKTQSSHAQALAAKEQSLQSALQAALQAQEAASRWERTHAQALEQLQQSQQESQQARDRLADQQRQTMQALQALQALQDEQAQQAVAERVGVQRKALAWAPPGLALSSTPARQGRLRPRPLSSSQSGALRRRGQR